LSTSYGLTPTIRAFGFGHLVVTSVAKASRRVEWRRRKQVDAIQRGLDRDGDIVAIRTTALAHVRVALETIAIHGTVLGQACIAQAIRNLPVHADLGIAQVRIFAAFSRVAFIGWQLRWALTPAKNFGIANFSALILAVVGIDGHLNALERSLFQFTTFNLRPLLTLSAAKNFTFETKTLEQAFLSACIFTIP
jgi:hypothetical protein